MSTGDKVTIIIVLSALALGLLSMFVGWLARKWDRFVNRSQAVMSSDQEQVSTDDTDRPTDRPSVSADDLYCPRVELDRSKLAIIEVMVYNGWTTGEIRSILKGDNGAIGKEVDAARERLGIEPPDNKTPIAQRRTDAEFAPR